MNPKHQKYAYINSDGCLVLPPEVSLKYGLKPGTSLHIEDDTNEFRVLRPTSQLAKIYIEATNLCNLDCVTCIRNVWDEPYGMMSQDVFERILTAVKQLTPRPTIIFQGFGEPLAHPHLADMILALKTAGATVELTTNGVLLQEDRLLKLIRSGLDRLWVSLDGATPDSYADVRLGASLPKVIENLERLPALRGRRGFQHDPRPQLGIAFVAMRRNIADLPEVLRLGARLGAKYFSISNVLAHTPDLHNEILYENCYHRPETLKSASNPIVNLPRIDTNSITQVPLAEIWSRKYVLLLAGKEINRAVDSCQFIEQGSTSVRWDGSISPCPPLLHTHDSFLDDRPRRVYSYFFGSLLERDLLEIWQDSSYTQLRERIQQFDFSPCMFCNCCEMAEDNMEDCVNSPPPGCGGCLWGQGLIQCP